MVDQLRSTAEELLKQDSESKPAVSTADTQKLVHELQVHQIELEMQNEELRRAQHELSDAHDAYVELYDFAPVGYLTLDQEGRIIEANFAAAALLGDDRGKLLVGRTFAGFVQRESLDEWEQHRRNVLRNEKKQYAQLSLKRPDGMELTAHIECSLRPASDQTLMVLVDITERKEAEKVQTHQRELLERLFENIPILLVVWDPSLEKFTLNHHVEKVLGWSDLDTNTGNLMEKILPDPVYRAEVENFMSELESGWREWNCLAKNGETIPIKWANIRLSDDTMIGIGVDLRERKKAEAELRKLNDELEQRIAERTDELRQSQHELRSLASELSLAEQRERQRLAAELHDGVSQLLSSSYIRLGALMESALPEASAEAVNTISEIIKETLTQIRSLTFELSCPMLRELGLSAALEELCSKMSSEYSINFEFHGELEPLPLKRDRQLVLYRSARELLMNVMKHSGATHARVDIERGDRHVCICVADDGVGFDAEMAGMGFSESGGFGLFNIGEYLRHAGGSLEIESIPGDGTQVVLTVPLEEDHG